MTWPIVLDEADTRRERDALERAIRIKAIGSEVDLGQSRLMGGRR